MKIFRYIGIGLVLAVSVSACNSNRNSATLGNSQDTMNAVAGSDVPVNKDTSRDTSKKGTADTTAKGNVSPTGHTQNNTGNGQKSHQPK